MPDGPGSGDYRSFVMLALPVLAGNRSFSGVMRGGDMSRLVGGNIQSTMLRVPAGGLGGCDSRLEQQVYLFEAGTNQLGTPGVL